MVKQRHCEWEPGPHPHPGRPTLHPPQASQAPGATRQRINKQDEAISLSLGSRARVVSSVALCGEPRVPGGSGPTRRGMVLPLPRGEHLRTPRPDVLMLHPPWCDNIPISSWSSLHASLPGVGSLPGADRPLGSCPSLRSIRASDTSPVKEAPQRLLHCQRALQVWAPAQPLPPRLASAPPPPNLLLPSSVTTFHSPLTSRLLISVRFSKLPHAHTIHTPCFPPPLPPFPRTTVQSSQFVDGGAPSHPAPPRKSRHPGRRLVFLVRKARWSVPACGRLASILNRQPAGNWVAEPHRAGEGASPHAP